MPTVNPVRTSVKHATGRTNITEVCNGTMLMPAKMSLTSNAPSVLIKQLICGISKIIIYPTVILACPCKMPQRMESRDAQIDSELESNTAFGFSRS